MTYVMRTIIVTAADQALAQALATAIAADGAANMFNRELSPTGQAPGTHYIATGAIEAQFDALLHDAAAMYAAAQATGAPVTLAQCQALVADSTVQDLEAEDAFATMARLGLQLIQETP